MEEKIEDLFSKHFNRIKNDLNQIKGVTPVMLMVVSTGFRNLEEDIKEVLEDGYAMDKDTDQYSN